MKFSYKILFSCILTIAVAFGIGGYFFVNNVFQASMEREVGQAMEESSILKFAFETAALNIPYKYGRLQDSAVEEIGQKLEKSGQENRLLRLSDEDRTVLYASEGFDADQELLSAVLEDARAWQTISVGGRYYIQTGMQMEAMDRALYLETMRDVTAVYQERNRSFLVYRNMTLLILAVSAVILYFISHWLTRPIRLLGQAARKMASGDYSCRADQVSEDEMGLLTMDFNHMAEVLEENIRKLEEEVRAREDFMAAFSHELKTPLTSIIGYADVLRSRNLDEEQHFRASNYIYTEGKRLEAMSFRLLDIIVTKRYEPDLQDVDVKALFGYLEEIYGKDHRFRFVFQYDPGQVRAEEGLLKSVLLNLADNACKASEPGGVIEFLGENREQGYYFAVKDHGMGIPEEECRKITEAFYMVDKSRSRSHNGAGLGLALCKEIIKLHGSSLEIESTLGEGSCFWFLISHEEK